MQGLAPRHDITSLKLSQELQIWQSDDDSIPSLLIEVASAITTCPRRASISDKSQGNSRSRCSGETIADALRLLTLDDESILQMQGSEFYYKVRSKLFSKILIIHKAISA